MQGLTDSTQPIHGFLEGGISAEEVGWKRLGISQGQTMILSSKNDLNMENTVVDLTE
jgi:hypothetical protein